LFLPAPKFNASHKLTNNTAVKEKARVLLHSRKQNYKKKISLAQVKGSFKIF